jgi:hypothetical protein
MRLNFPIMRAAILVLLFSLLAISLPSAAVNAQSGNQWTAYYYNNSDWTGNAAYIESTPLISYNWGNASPANSIPTDMFSVSYVTQAFFYAGMYSFTTTADDEVALIIDGVTYIDTRGQGQSGKSQTIQLSMWQGMHQVQVLYREYTDTAYVYVTWSYIKSDPYYPYYPPAPLPPPVPAPTPVPPMACGPVSQTSVQTQFGDYTPCIQNGEHQSACYQSSGQWDSPNLGSIQTEPQIQVWMACTPDSVTSFTVSCDPEVPQEEFKCSKTGAGYFPN